MQRTVWQNTKWRAELHVYSFLAQELREIEHRGFRIFIPRSYNGASSIYVQSYN